MLSRIWRMVSRSSQDDAESEDVDSKAADDLPQSEGEKTDDRKPKFFRKRSMKLLDIPVDLPESVSSFYTKMKSLQLLESDDKITQEYPPDVKNIIKYSATALEIGRPLNKVMIVMAGQSGAGKSTTINSLFNDKICATSTCKSETRDVTEYGKQLCVTAERPPVKGFLSFVDIPGSLDVEQTKEAFNLAAIMKFRNKHSDLANREGFFQTLYSVSKEVYPNLVLMVVKAGDNRMVGTDSNLKKSLEILGKCNMLDPNMNNLIIVVTHAMSLPRVRDRYEQASTEIINNIREAVFQVLHIRNVTIVFVENDPEGYGMEKDTQSDFYKLPDGQLSHFNLIQAIVEQFKMRNDYLGRLLCGWYFGDNCPEKNVKPEVLSSTTHSTLSTEETKEAEKCLGRLSINTEDKKDDDIPLFPFQYLGRGYCPITESTKNINVYSGTENKRVDILGKKYIVPKCLVVVPKTESMYHRLSSETRDMYEKSKMQSYGLEADVKLIVNVDSRGRWVKGNKATNNRAVVSVLHERRQTNIRFDDPESNMKKQLSSALNELPTQFNNETASHFHEFFSKWGSHFICEVWIGGCVKVDYTVTASTFTDEKANKFVQKLQCVSKGIQPQARYESSDATDSSKQEDSLDEQISISGGDPPHVTSLAELAPQFKAWLESIKTDPTELQHSFKLSPYYDVVDGEQKTSLRMATIAYLGQTISENLNIKRDDLSKQIVSDVTQETVNKSCFPPSSTVCTKDGIVSFRDLKPGVEVLSVETHQALPLHAHKITYTELFSFAHYDPEKVANFIVFRLENKQSLTVTGDHLIFCYHKGTIRTVRAKTVKIGDQLVYVSNFENSSKKQFVESVRVVDINLNTIKGVYCPLTYNGTLVVDGSLVSCYANIDSHALAHVCMKPLRWWHRVKKSTKTSAMFIKNTLLLATDDPNKTTSVALAADKIQFGIHKYAEFLSFIRQFLPFNAFRN